ncbi:MAG TPA: sigma-70 family RNA polymerase sigma factor [Actinomycetota bacterium]|nr:sigma-70 family RNA polymerase sigma factor [Actinomycetota bacterium]
MLGWGEPEAHAPERPVRTPLNPRSEDGPLRSGSQDTLEAYLREIGRVALLTAEQEVALATRMSVGHEAEKLLADPAGLDLAAVGALARRAGVAGERPLGPGEAYTLCRRLRADGQAAKDHMIEANLRLVVSIAKRYRGHGMHLIDLVQEGNLGLIRGVEKFDVTRGFKLSTYATWWIRQAIARAIADRDRTVRLPVHVVDAVHALRRVQSDLVQQLGRQPTVEDVAAWMAIPADEVRRLQAAAREPVSLDVPIGDQTSARLGDFIEDTEAPEATDVVAVAMLRERVASALAGMSDREREIVGLRYGIADGVPRTLDQVGSLVGLSRERVRHVERRAMCKLRHPCAGNQLRDFTG